MARYNLEVVTKNRSDKYKNDEEEKKEPIKSSKTEKKIKKKEKITEKKKENKIKKDKEKEEIKKLNPFLKFILKYLLIFTTIFLVYSILIEPKLFYVKEYKLVEETLPDSFHGLKIIQLSDINYGSTFTSKDLEEITEKVNELNPDIVFFTGNLIDKSLTLDKENKDILITNLTKINASINKYAIYGNNDSETFKEIMELSNFHILNNETSLLYYEDNTPLLIAGFNTQPDFTIFENIPDIDPSTIYKIVLSHDPHIIDNIKQYDPNLILSGKTLGGLINPGFTKPIILKKQTKYYKDFYEIDNIKLYVSNGLGSDSINMRFNNAPSINFFRLYTK